MEKALFSCESCGAEYKHEDMNDNDGALLCDLCFCTHEEIELE